MHNAKVHRELRSGAKLYRRLGVALTALLLLSACSSPSDRGGSAAATPSSPGGAASTGAPKSLVIALANEPSVLALPIPGAGSSITGTDDVSLAVTHRLVGHDNHGKAFPMLAAELPSRDKGTWVVRPDGSMRTTYVLRNNLTWHDGAAVTANDFVFANALVSNKDFPLGRDVLDLVSEVQAPDPRTVAIEWKVTYPFAGEASHREFVPYPTHLLQGSYREMTPDQFMQLPFWREEFVGTGPYQMSRWESGIELEVRAYPNFYGGRARIDRVIFRFIPDGNTAVANLLAGTVDGEIPLALAFDQGMLVRREWERAGLKPTVVLEVDSWRHIHVQFREPQYPDFLDVRVRRGLLHAIDRVALAAALLDGETPVADTVFPPTDARWAWVQDVVAKYPYDLRRAQGLLADAGWRRGADGGLVRSSGERVAFPLWTAAGEETEKTIAIVADYWKDVGVQVEQNPISRARYRDRPYRISFPAFLYAGISAEYFNPLRRMEGRECPSAETGWVGSNFGCYQNPELDGPVEGLRGAIDPATQRQLWRDVVKIQTEQLPVLPMYFRLNVTVFREGVTGVKGNTQPQIGATWNIAEWDVR